MTALCCPERPKRGQPSAPRAAVLTEALPPLEALGTAFPPYRPLHDVPMDAEQAAILALPVEGGLIRTEPPGFLRPADALTLYELARHGPGDVLELGAAWGLSATILCRGVRARGAGRVVSVEIDPAFQRAAAEAIRRAGLARWHQMRAGDAGTLLQDAVSRGERFGAVFVDHDHGLEASRLVCRLLPRLLLPGGMALFHDFNDVRNIGGEYGVYQAVREMLEAGPELALRGLPGCCALVGWDP